MAACFVSHAEPNELGSSNAASARAAASRSMSARHGPRRSGPPPPRSVTTSSTPGTSWNNAATDARAATDSRAPANRRRTSAMAGSAITASPSQFGATTRRREISGIGFRLGLAVVHRQRRAGERRIAVAPAAMHPQPELGMTPYVHLEHVGAALGELADRV